MTIPAFADAAMKVGGHFPRTLAAGQAFVLDARLLRAVRLIAGAGATVTVSRVDSATAGANALAAADNFAVAGGTTTSLPVDWPFYRISTTGSACRIAPA